MLVYLCRALGAERHELPALAWAFAYFFLLLAAYYVLRPVRDEMGVQAGTAALPWLFSATFAAMLLLVPLYGWLCARLPRARLLPAVYAFFAANLLLFWAALAAGAPLAAPYFRARRGHPVALSKKFFTQLLALKGDEGARTLLAAHERSLVKIPVGDPGVIRDIDRPEDLAPPLRI